MSKDSQLSARSTFESQRSLVNRTMIPTIHASLDYSTYPVDNIIIQL